MDEVPALASIDSSDMHDDGIMLANEDRTIRRPDAEVIDRLKRWAKSPNIAIEPDAEITDELLNAIGMRVTREYDIDVTSRADWKKKVEKADKIANQLAETKTYPWPGASNILFPLITNSSLQFAARAYPAIISGRNVVRGSVVGPDKGTPLVDPRSRMQAVDPQTGKPQWIEQPGSKQARAYRIGAHMSWQLLDEQTEWEPETDKLLHVLPMVGTAFRKVYFDAEKQRNASVYVSALDLVVNYHARSLERAPRITEEISLYPNEVEAKERAGIFVEHQYSHGPDADASDEDAPIQLLEQHRWLDLDQDGVKEPYIVTVDRLSSKVVRIVARYEIEGIHWNASRGKIAKIDPVHYYQLYQFLPNFELKGSIYGTGFGRLLLPLNESINTSLNMLIDAGHLANTQGGFVGKGLSLNSGSMKFTPGEYKVVNVSGATVRDNIVPLKFDGPSPVLFQLLSLLIETGKEVAAVKDVLSGENMPANTPATTTLAMIEQGLKVFSSIYKRVHRSLKGELGMLFRLNRIYLDQESSYKEGEEWKSINRADYEKGAGVEPFSDPTMVTDQQRLGRGAFLMQFANDPMMNGLEIRKRMLEAASIEEIDKLLNMTPPPNPAIAVKGMELEIRHKEVASRERLQNAQAIYQLAAAINQFAQADKAVGDTHMGWIETQLQVLQQQMDAAIAQGAGQDASAGMPGAPGAPPSAPASGHGPTKVALPGAISGDQGPLPGSPQSFLGQAEKGGMIQG